MAAYRLRLDVTAVAEFSSRGQVLEGTWQRVDGAVQVTLRPDAGLTALRDAPHLR